MLILALCARVLYEESFPIGWSLPCAAFLMLPLIAAYLIRAGICVGVRCARIPPVRRRTPVWWFVAPTLLLLAVALDVAHVPFRVRFAHSRRELEAEARQLLATSQPQLEPGLTRCNVNKQLGWYFVGLADVDSVRQHVYFIIGHGIRPMGLVFTGSSSEPPEQGCWRVPYLPDDWALFAAP